MQQTYNNNGNVTNHEKKHFVLVHGGSHGAWCWYKLTTLLRSAGHNVTALDLCASGINQKQVLELRSIADYHEPLMKFMESIPAKERVILVGHSFGGFGLSKAMETFPEKIVVAVFVTAFMPGPTLDAYTLFQEALEEILDCLSSVQIRNTDDRLIWGGDSFGYFTTKSFLASISSVHNA